MDLRLHALVHAKYDFIFPVTQFNSCFQLHMWHGGDFISDNAEQVSLRPDENQYFSILTFTDHQKEKIL